MTDRPPSNFGASQLQRVMWTLKLSASAGTTCAALVSIVLVAALAACGGGSSVSEPIQGRIADGYLRGATVFWDCNGNMALDTDEPRATTTEGGRYTISPAPAARTPMEFCTLRALIPATAIDEDTFTPVGKAFMMSASGAAPTFISPLTTLQSSGAFTEEEILARFPASARLPLTTDYIAAGPAGRQLHNTAQFITRTLQWANSTITKGDAAKVRDVLITAVATVPPTAFNSLNASGNTLDTFVASLPSSVGSNSAGTPSTQPGSSNTNTTPSEPVPNGGTAVFAGNAAFSNVVVPALRILPLPSCNGTSWSSMLDGMKNGLIPQGFNWYFSPGACGVKLFVLNSEAALDKFVIFVVRDGTTQLSDMALSAGDALNNLADAAFTNSIFSYSTEDLTELQVTQGAVPQQLRALFAAGNSYDGMTRLKVPRGAQLFSQAAIRGALGDLLSGPVNLPTDRLWLRVEQERKTFEILLPAGQILTGPLGMEAVSLSDLTVSIDRDRNISLMGNSTFRSMPGKVAPLVIDTPALVPGAWPRNWAASQISLNAPRTLGLNDYVNLIADLSTQPAQAVSQIGFIKDIVPTDELMSLLRTMSKPLSAFKMKNPDPNADNFRLAAGTGYPDLALFNFILLGSQARAKDGTNTPGPLLRFKADVEVFGQQLARSDTLVSRTSFQTNSSGGFNIGLGTFGISNPQVNAIVDVGVNPQKADINLRVNSPVRNFNFVFNENQIVIHSPANCLAPLNLNATVNIQGATAESLLSGLTPSEPSPQLIIDCGFAIGALIAQAAQEVAQAVTFAANAIADATTVAVNAAYTAVAGAVNDTINFVTSGINNAIAAVGNVFGTGGSSVCNQRIEWLRDQGNRPDPVEVRDMIDRIYQPMKSNADAGRASADLIERQQLYWSNAHEAYRSIEQYWNSHPLRGSALPAFDSYHQASNTLAFDWAGRANNLRASANRMDQGNQEGTSTKLQELIKWLPFSGFEVDGGWRGHNEAENLWARCAAAWIADRPVTTAQLWGISVPLHQGSAEAMFMPRQDYLNVRAQLAGIVAGASNEITVYKNDMAGFTNSWSNSSRRFYEDLLTKAGEGRLIYPGEPGSAQARYAAAVNRLKSEALEIMKMEGKVHSCQVMRTLDNLLRAKEEATTGISPALAAQRPAHCGAPNYPRGPMNEQLLSVFDPIWYLGNHPDVRSIIGNSVAAAQSHWLQYGVNEGRAASWNFAAPTYAALNPDLPAGYGATNWLGMTLHWPGAGIFEGRQTTTWLD